MDKGDWLEVFIPNEQHVAMTVKEMANPVSKYKKIVFREEAAKVIGDKGNQAVSNHLATALENCMIPGVHIIFSYCNLSETSVQLLANALEKNTTIGAFTCEQNPFNFPNGKDYDPKSDDMVKRAIIKTKAPITKWNGYALPQDVREARRLHAATSSPSIEALDNIPSAEKLAVVETILTEARAELSQQKAKFDTDTKAKADVKTLAAQQKCISNERIAELEREMKTLERELSAVKAQKSRDMSANDNKTAALTRNISAAEQKMEQARATIARCEKFQKDLEVLKARLGHLFITQAPPVAAPPPPEDPNLCGICMDNPKNHAFIKCGHQVCGVCADTVMQKNEKCPYCKQDISDVLRLF